MCVLAGLAVLFYGFLRAWECGLDGLGSVGVWVFGSAVLWVLVGLTDLAVVWCRSLRAWECCLCCAGLCRALQPLLSVLYWSWRGGVGLYHAPICNRFIGKTKVYLYIRMKFDFVYFVLIWFIYVFCEFYCCERLN